MKQQDQLKTPVHSSTIIKRIIYGGVIALILISFFLSTVDEPKPEWGKFWMVRPLIIVPLAGAMGGIFYHYMDSLRSRGGWVTVAAIIIGLLGYIIILWLGTVLGLDGTLWN